MIRWGLRQFAVVGVRTWVDVRTVVGTFSALGVFTLMGMSVLFFGCAPGGGFDSAAPKQRSAEISSGIIGGQDFQTTSIPLKSHLVGIMDLQGNFICSGTIISAKVILTAAHCIGKKVSKMFIVFDQEMNSYWENTSGLFLNPKVRPVRRVVVHEKYKNQHKDSEIFNWADIALIEIQGDLPSGFSAATVLEDMMDLLDAPEVTLAGYGVDQASVEYVDKPKSTKPSKEEGDYFCISADLCVRVNTSGDGVARWIKGEIQSVQESEFVIDNSSAGGTCSGDSGGGVFVQKEGRYYVAGITSHGSATCDGLSVYTSTWVYQSWIKQKMLNWGY